MRSRLDNGRRVSVKEIYWRIVVEPSIRTYKPKHCVPPVRWLNPPKNLGHDRLGLADSELEGRKPEVSAMNESEYLALAQPSAYEPSANHLMAPIWNLVDSERRVPLDNLLSICEFSCMHAFVDSQDPGIQVCKLLLHEVLPRLEISSRYHRVR